MPQDKMLIVYRACENETTAETIKPYRPFGFNKTKNWLSLQNNFTHDHPLSCPCDITLVMDGENDISQMFPLLNDHNGNLRIREKILTKRKLGNKNSYIYCLEYAYKYAQEYKYIYFLEDDYFHKLFWNLYLNDGLHISDNSCVVSLYDHPDRYTRDDDLVYDAEKHIFMGDLSHWRYAESTTCTWATSSELFIKIYTLATHYGIQDRKFFRTIKKECDVNLLTALPGISTHLHEPYISPFFILNYFYNSQV